MSRVSKGLVGDTGAVAAIANHTFVYTTDDPSLTAASATTFADGDGTLVTAEVLQCFNDLSAKVNLILAALRDSGTIQT